MTNFKTIFHNKTLLKSMAYLAVASLARVACIHFMAEGMAGKEGFQGFFIVFLLLLVLHEWARKMYSKKLLFLVFGFFSSLRKEMARKALLLGAAAHGRLLKDGLLSSTFQEISYTEANAQRLYTFVQSLVFVLAYLGYIAFLNYRMFLFLLPIAAIIGFLFSINGQQTMKSEKDTRPLFAEKNKRSGRILTGIKELLANSRKSNNAYSNFKKATEAYFLAEAPNTRLFFASRNLPEILLKGLSVLLFLSLAFFENSQNPQLFFRLLTSLLFLLHTLVSLLAQAEGVYSVFSSYQNIRSVLDGMEHESEKSTQGYVPPMPFSETLSLKTVSMAYKTIDQKPFVSGPFSLDIKKGETIFVVGGNGSGKTTFLKLLIGLFKADEGAKISVDGTEVNEGNLQSYQELFFVLTADFYAFTQPFGIENVPQKTVERLLRLLELDKAVSYSSEGFSTNRLSTGQKKRLGLLWGFLENKEIYVYDEAGADQDPVNRRKFYEFILPDMKKAGKTVIAVSHDERYFKHADRVMVMGNGRLTERIPK